LRSADHGWADNGDLDTDLLALLTATGEAAKAANKGVVLCIDELQYVQEDELAALITSLHRTSQLTLPLMLIGSPGHGDTAFTVPMFDQFMKRIMPELEI
jgi:type II secretory pathway predicted ATPase ExeA